MKQLIARVLLAFVVLLPGSPVRAAAQPSALPTFCDLASGDPAYPAVLSLAVLGIVRGYETGCFGGGDTILRAQMAALIARGMVWDNDVRGNAFPDRDGIDDNLWNSVGALAARGVARGYADGTFDPLGPVLQAQTISFIARAMVSKGRWQQQADDPKLYQSVPASSGHRADITTFVAYAGPLPDRPLGTAFDWNQPSTRAWFARAFWQALNWQAQPGLDSEESAFLTLINLYRDRQGVGQLATAPTLVVAAKWMSADLATRVKAPGDFSHLDSLGRDPFVRMCVFGYCLNTWKGENIAAGSATAAATFIQWRDSPGHNENMVRAEFKTIGIGRAQGGYYGWYWTTDFGGQ